MGTCSLHVFLALITSLLSNGKHSLMKQVSDMETVNKKAPLKGPLKKKESRHVSVA